MERRQRGFDRRRRGLIVRRGQGQTADLIAGGRDRFIQGAAAAVATVENLRAQVVESRETRGDGWRGTGAELMVEARATCLKGEALVTKGVGNREGGPLEPDYFGSRLGLRGHRGCMLALESLAQGADLDVERLALLDERRSRRA